MADDTQDSEGNSKRRKKLSQADVPSVSLKEALRIPEALRDHYGMEPATPIDIGVAVGIAPTSGGFRTMAGAALAYGLTNGGPRVSEIGLTELGQRAVAPVEEGDDEIAKREAFERPRVINEFVEKYNGSRLPSEQIAKNVLHGFGVPLDSTQRVYDLVLDGLQSYGYLRTVNGAQFVQRPTGSGHVQPTPDDEFEGELGDASQLHSDLHSQHPEPEPPAPLVDPASQRPNAIFLGHGKNRKPLDQLVKILDEYGIPHKQATAEANAGRPIPVKVADTMRECGAAILIFTADEELRDLDGNTVWRPSENVVHELGAASVLYDNRIIIFKEDGVTLASNFSSIGYISFDKDKLSDKGIELFRELVNFKIVSITVG